MSAVEDYRARRAARVAARERAKGKFPASLLKKAGIKPKPGWTAKDAWKALAAAGITPEDVFRDLAGIEPRLQIFPGLSLDYNATCKLARELGHAPVDHPAEELLAALKEVVADCLGKVMYEVTKPDMVQLAGIYVFSACEEEPEDQNALGITSLFGSDDEKAVIGLAAELFAHHRPGLWRIVLLHELAHLRNGELAHNAAFQHAENAMFEAYFDYSELGDNSVEETSQESP